MVSGSDSRVKKKQKMVFAKSKKEVVILVIVMLAFFGNGLRMIVQYFQTQAAEKAAMQNVASSIDEGFDPAMPPGSTTAEQTVSQDAKDIYNQTMDLKKDTAQNSPNVFVDPDAPADTNAKKMGLSKNPNKVTIVVANSGRQDPFMPESEALPPSLSYLTPPPETVAAGSQAAEVMSTTISGILFDKYSPSAIINISGSDYLVKRGDVINGYKVLAIEKTQVLVQLGKNTYKAGVGELLSKTNMNFNTIANLNRKFGGNDVAIHVRKKGY